jgi:UDP-N-acetyl-D-mannosaminuronate dehydrogenase
LKRFFRGQERLKDLRVDQDLKNALQGIDAVIFAVRHKHYLSLDPDEVIEMAGEPIAVIDCFGILDDERIRRYFELGCEVKGLGKDM